MTAVESGWPLFARAVGYYLPAALIITAAAVGFAVWLRRQERVR